MNKAEIDNQYNTWLNDADMPAELKHDLRNMQDDEDTKVDAFGTSLSFGTAGMRGLLGAGTNRMKIYTVR